MTDKVPHLPQNHITQEQFDAISGGDCSIKDWQEAFANLQQSYEDLIEFTSYMFERVLGP